jgi:hypothetical protein
VAKAKKKTATHDAKTAEEAREALNWIAFCLAIHDPIPDWTRKPFITAVNRVNSLEVRSFDDVFGHPLKKGKHLEPAQRRLRFSGLIFDRVRERRAAGEPITKDLLESVGEEFNVRGTVASEMYCTEATRLALEETEIFSHATKDTK